MRVGRVIVGVMLVMTLGGCSLHEDLATFHLKMYGTALPEAVAEWKAMHAAVVGVTVEAIDQRWALGARRGQLDSPQAKGYWFDLSTDFCSASPDSGRSYDFKAACLRHDFGWRNLKRLDERWNCPGATTNRPCGTDGLPAGAIGGFFKRANKLAVNTQFRRDMDAHCATRPAAQRPECHRAAALYHAVVNLAA